MVTSYFGQCETSKLHHFTRTPSAENSETSAGIPWTPDFWWLCVSWTKVERFQSSALAA